MSDITYKVARNEKVTFSTCFHSARGASYSTLYHFERYRNALHAINLHRSAFAMHEGTAKCLAR